MDELHQITVKNSGSVLTVSLNNPEKRNVLSPVMLNEISNVLSSIRDDSNIRCVVIKGSGGKAFSSGYDITSIKEDDMMREFGSGHPLEECLKSIAEYPYPVIAMMNGHTFGAGLELAVTCDLRVCSESAKIGIPPVKLGVVYTYSGTKKFLNLIGTAYTKELFLTGNTIDAERAETIGLVNYVVSDDEIENFTVNLANTISESAPLSLSTMKKLIGIWERNQSLDPEDEQIVRDMFTKVQQSDDYKEGQRAFEEKRKPKFKGK